jgi:hypothetical protein
VDSLWRIVLEHAEKFAFPQPLFTQAIQQVTLKFKTIRSASAVLPICRGTGSQRSVKTSHSPNPTCSKKLGALKNGLYMNTNDQSPEDTIPLPPLEFQALVRGSNHTDLFEEAGRWLVALLDYEGMLKPVAASTNRQFLN